MAKFEKGQSGNPNGAPKKQSGNLIDVHFVGNQNMPEFPKPPASDEIVSNEWIDWGSDNRFPNAIAQLNRKSPVHRGILNRKTIFLSGKGFNTGLESEDEVLKLKHDEFNGWLNKCNANGESLKAVVKKILFDKLCSGNGFMEIAVTKNSVAFYHRDYTQCRLSREKTHILIHKDWLNIKKDDIITIPLYPEFEKGDKGVKRSIIHLKDYEPEFTEYGVATWIAGFDSAGIAYKTNKWNISRLDNSFSSSGVLVVEGNITPDQSKKMKQDFKTEFTGEGKQGKIMMIVKQVGGGETKFTPTETNKEGEWLQLQKQSRQDLLDVHGWYQSLSAGDYSDGFNAGRVRNEYNLAMSTVIGEEQEAMLGVLVPLINDLTEFDASEMSFIQVPLSLQDLLDPKNVLTKNEQREIFGFEKIEEQILDSALVGSLLSVLTSANTGEIPRETAKQTLITAFGLQEDKAEALLSTIGEKTEPLI